MQAGVRLDHELLAVEDDHDVHVMLELDVPELDTATERPSVRVALALDRSGSMAGHPLETVKRASRFLAERLGPDDQLALVTYDDEVELVQSMAPVDIDQLGTRIDGITSGGMTNLSGGWLKAIEEARRRDDGIRRVLLLTDGQANQGITDHDQLVSVARSTAERGVSTTTVGVGPNFAEELLTAVADAGAGRGWFAESVEDLPAIFGEEFDDLVAVAAQNVSVEVRPGADVDVVGVLNEYPSVAVDGGVQVQLGDAYAGQQLRVVLRLHVPQLSVLGPTRVAELVLQYAMVGDEIATHTQVLPIVVNAVSAEEAAAATGDPEVADEVAVLAAASATTEARELAEQGRIDEAAELLRSASTDLRAAADRAGTATDLHERAATLDRTVDELTGDAFDATSSKRLHYQSTDMRRGRHRKDRDDDE